jgi:hypothetical protein
MKLALRTVACLCLSSALSFAASWSGFLVDSRCFGQRERNVNPTDTLTAVDRDQNSELRYCSPNGKTKSFALVQQDGSSFNLDSAGNAKAVELVRTTTGKKPPFIVTVTGEARQHTITVDSISIAH